MPLTHSKRTSAILRSVREEEALHGPSNVQWRQGDDSADGGVFALDGDEEMDAPGSYKKRKRKASVMSTYMDEDMIEKEPGRFSFPAAAALLSAANADSSLNHPVLLGNGSSATLKHNLSDQALDASAALSQLSSSISPASSAPSVPPTNVPPGFSFANSPYTFNPSATGAAGATSLVQTPNNATATPPVKMATAAWLGAYAQGVSPFTSQASFQPLDAVELQRVLNMPKQQLETLPPDTLVRALMECAKMAHGSRYTGNLDTSAQHAWKSWTLVKVCTGKNRVHTIGSLAQTLVSSLELLVYYFIGTSDFYKVRVVVHNMYHIYLNHRPYIADATAHRVLGFMIGNSCCLDDVEFYLAKAKALNLQATTPYETSGWVVLSLMLATSVIGIGDKDTLPTRTRPLSERESNHKTAVLHVIDESDKAVSFYEATPAGSLESNTAKVCKIHRLVLEGCRALVYWQRGFDAEAVEHAKNVLNSLKPCEVSRLPHLMSLTYCTHVARCTNQGALYQKGLEMLAEGIDFYPYIRLLYNELKKPPTALEMGLGPDDTHLITGDECKPTLLVSGANGLALAASPSSSVTNGSSLSHNTSGSAGSPIGLFKNQSQSSSSSNLFARSGSSGFTSSKNSTASSSLNTTAPMAGASASSAGGGISSGQSGVSSPVTGLRSLSVSGAQPLSSLTGKFESTGSPRASGSEEDGVTPMRPNPMKVSLLSRAGSTSQSMSPQAMQSISPQGMQSVSPHHFQAISPHLGVSPLTQGLSPFAGLSTQLIQPHLLPPGMSQFSPQIPSFLNVGAFSPMHSNSPNSWSNTPNINGESYMMDSSESSQAWN